MIRCAVKQDLEGVLSLYELLFSEMAALDPERMQPAKQATEFVENAITDDNFHLLVADYNGEVKGFCFAQKQSADSYNCMVNRDFAYIFDLVVAPELRGQQIGHQFIEQMKIWAKKNELSHLELTVLAKNHKAIKFYKREGLTEITRTVGVKLD